MNTLSRRESARGRLSALLVTALLSLTILAGGCQPVREDRSIHWSAEGQSVGFQHGPEGVFLADPDGGKLTRIFQPSADVIATSTPLWAPQGRRVLFTTARATDRQPGINLNLGGDNPAGNLHTQRPVIYQCWLYEPSDEGEAKPKVIFEAACDHVGYVAANLAVRWHPQGDRILYVQQTAQHRHGLFEHDLATGKSRQVFPHLAEALLFDWSPDGAKLCCLLGSAKEPAATDGVWVGVPGAEGWWQVPDSGRLARAELPSVLEQLRATRPAWTTDSARFAFVSCQPGPDEKSPGKHLLRLANLTTHETSLLTEADEPFHDLRWTADGKVLGLVCGREQGRLHLLRPGEPLAPALSQAPVRRFAGWNHKGDRLAYVVADRVPLAEEPMWAFLLVADPSARDAVLVADGSGAEAGREVFAGMRVTFPQWSPKEDRLSLWVTFQPAYRSLVSQMLGWGLRPGDPAAVLDVKTGALSWMPVNAHEKVQVGHYFLLKRDYEQAWHWYDQAERDLPAKEVTITQPLELLPLLRGPRDFSFFAYHCLRQLGREADAQAKLKQFRRVFLPRWTGSDSGADSTWQEVLAPDGMFAPLLQDLYSAEVFLSLDAAAEGEAFFRREMADAKTDPAKMSAGVVLGQLLLLQAKHREYAQLAMDYSRLAWKAPRLKWKAVGELYNLAVRLSLLPLMAPEFLIGLPDEQVRRLIDHWQALREVESAEDRLFVDHALLASFDRLGQERERQEAAQRLERAGAPPLALGDIEELRTQVRALLGLINSR